MSDAGPACERTPGGGEQSQMLYSGPQKGAAAALTYQPSAVLA